MRSKLNLISDWEKQAAVAKYKVKVLAKMNGVSISQLERYFAGSTGLSPLDWMTRLRQVRGLALLHQGCSVKRTAYELGYRQSSHFSREFKRFYGVAPTDIRPTSLPCSRERVRP
jgi:AraC-like DNA-binding protein